MGEAAVIWGRLTEAFWLNCQLFGLTLLFALPLGLVVSFGSMSRLAPLRGVVKTFVWVIRGTPLMLQILVIYLGPGLLGFTSPWPSGGSGRLVAAVGLQHSGVHGVDVGGIHADENLVDGGVDVLNSLADALAAEAALVAVAQLQSLKFTGGRTAGGSTAANRAVGQPYLCLDGGVAAGVDDLAANDLLNFQIAHGTKSFLYKLLFQYARNGIKRYFKGSAS